MRFGRKIYQVVAEKELNKTSIKRVGSYAIYRDCMSCVPETLES